MLGIICIFNLLIIAIFSFKICLTDFKRFKLFYLIKQNRVRSLCLCLTFHRINFQHKRTYTSDADIYIIYFLMMHQKEFVISNIGGNPPTTTRLITHLIPCNNTIYRSQIIHVVILFHDLILWS